MLLKTTVKRQLLLALLIMSCTLQTYSQNTGIGVGTTNPHASAEFEINSTNKGFLPPRMTTAQRNTISNPATGLIIWCTDCLPKGEVQVYNGTEWTNMTGGAAAVNYVQLPSVTIGTQIWQSKNLDVATYRNGNPIPQVTDGTQWANLTTGAWCWYNNDSATSYAATYGRLYNWYAVADPRGLCPTGWHVPSDGEWTTLTNFLGGAFVAGGKMKSTTGWTLPNSGATNSSGFTGLPGGLRGTNGSFSDIGSFGYWWSSTENGTNNAWRRLLYYFGSDVLRGDFNKPFGHSVRCLRD